MKRVAFERLNTGGVALSQQEVRNCLYYGKFNQLLLELTRNPIFANAWRIPLENDEELAQNNFYKKMEDAELVLRFFALRHTELFLVGEACCLLANIQSIQINGVATDEVQATTVMEVGLKFDVDARKELRLYQLNA